MNYENYVVTDYVFMNGLYVDWTEEQKQEVLATFPESKDSAEKIVALNQALVDIEDGILKTNDYGEINRNSAKSYANRHDFFHYGKISRYYGNDDLYMYIDGVKKKFSRSYIIRDTIAYFSNTELRFKAIADIYANKEKEYFNEVSKESYEESNSERIDANGKAIAWLDALRLEITTGIAKSSYSSEYKPYINDTDFRKKVSGFNYIFTNEHEELLFHGEIVSKEDAETICKMTEDLSIKIGFMIDKYVAEMELLKLKYKELSEEKDSVK